MNPLDWVGVVVLLIVLVGGNVESQRARDETLAAPTARALPAGTTPIEGSAGTLLVSDPLLANALTQSLGRGVRTRVEDGIVILEGEVASRAERQRVLRLVRQIPGVRGIVDHLTMPG